jgi:hypothetical protein
VAALLDLTGENFGFLTVIERAPRPEGVDHRLSFWKVRCRCGAEVVCRSDALRGCTRRKCCILCPYQPEKICVSRREFGRDGSQQFFEVNSEENK